MKMTLKKFASRFSRTDWNFLLSHDHFVRAVESSEWEQAVAIAREILG